MILSAGCPDEFPAEADQATGGHNEFQLGPAVLTGFHVLHLALTGAEFFDATADGFLRHIHHQGFHLGSQGVPSMVRKITCGCETWNS